MTLGDLRDGGGPPRAEVHGVADGGVGLQREQDALHDVGHVREVTGLVPVLEHDRRAPVHETRREDRSDSRVGVRECLAGAIDVEEAERDRGDPVGRAGDEAHLLVIALVDRVDRRRDERLALRSADRAQLSAALRARQLPLAGKELLLGPRRRRRSAVLATGVLTLAVDRHRRGHDHPDRHRALRDDALQKARRRHGVQLGVARDLVHGLADADGRGEVHDAVDARERAIRELRIADVSDDQLHAARHLRDHAVVNLLLEAVEDDDLLAAVHERANQVRADEPSAARHERLHDVPILLLREIIRLINDLPPRVLPAVGN